MNGHACRWCFKHDCPDPTTHHRLDAASETTWRLDILARNRCDGCGQDRRNGPCPIALLTA